MKIIFDTEGVFDSAVNPYLRRVKAFFDVSQSTVREKYRDFKARPQRAYMASLARIIKTNLQHRSTLVIDCSFLPRISSFEASMNSLSAFSNSIFKKYF